MSIFQSQKSIAIYLTWARPGEGKTIDMARTILKLFKEYSKTEKKYPSLPHRRLYANLKLSEEVERKELNKHLFYWENPQQLRWCDRSNCFKSNEKHPIHDCDIVIDEVQNYCPADGWKDLPRWIRKLFAQYRHRGLRIFATTQDYKAVDINFRRMVKIAYKVQKLFSSRDISATMPPPSFIFGVIFKREFDPEQIEHEGTDENELEETSGFPSFFLLTKKLVRVYDTTQDIPEWMPNSLEHLEFKCLNPKCNKIHIEHRKI